MIKNITIAVLIVVSVICLLYAFFQSTAASKSLLVAEKNLVLAIEARKVADNQSRLSAEATLALTKAEENLKKCKASK